MNRRPTTQRKLAILRRNDHLPILESELRGHGVNDYLVVEGGKHPLLTFLWDGKQRTLPIPFSPRSRSRSSKNILAQLRRILKGDGPNSYGDR